MSYIKSVENTKTNTILSSTSPMVQYNVKLYDYGSEQQLRIYKQKITVNEDSEVKKKRKKIKKDSKSEILEFAKEINNYELFENILQGFDEDNLRSITSSANRSKNKVYEYARSNEWDYFFTLTFDPKKIDSTDYELVTKKLSQWIKNVKRDYAPDMVYILVPELHKDGKKFHFHGLFKNIGNLKLTDSGKRDKFKRPIYNIGRYKYGWTTVTKIADPKKASNYISKYITKSLCNETKGKKRYWTSSNIKKPGITTMNLNDEDIKKLLDSAKNQIVYENIVDVPNTNQQVQYYELRLSD